MAEAEVTARACFNVYCETYKSAIEAYITSALLAIATAAAAKAEAVKDSAKAWVRAIAVNPDAKVETTEAEIKADLFLERARIAEKKAETFLVKAKQVCGD